MRLNSTKKIISLFFHLYFLPFSIYAQTINVNTNYTEEQLIKDIFVGNNAIDVDESSIRITGWSFSDGDISFGYFSRNDSSFPIKDGILLSTGKLKDAPGPNTHINSIDDSNWKGDTDLERALDISRTTNATIIEFDFTSNNINQINFDYLFASEQYLRPQDAGNCGYTDGFAFLIKRSGSSESYKNLAVLPNTSTPVSVNTVYGIGGKCSPVNPQYFDQFNPTNSPISFNGQTKVLTATSSVIPNTKYHLKIVIADQGNGFYDSGVFLKAGSFSGVKSLGDDIILCPNSTAIINATTENAISYKWFKDGDEIENAINSQLTVNSIGFYEVEITLADGSIIKGNINVYRETFPRFVNQNFSICDEDLDGKVIINPNDYINQIINNYNSSFDIKFFETNNEAISNTTNSINSIVLDSTTSTKTIYIRIKVGDCNPYIQPIQFYLNNLSQSNSISKIEICDTNFSNIGIIFSDYFDYLVNNLDGDPKFYMSENDAKNAKNDIKVTQTITSNRIFWMRFKQIGLCENIVPIEFVFKRSKPSDILKDTIICKGTFATLDAGDGFDSYLWDFNNETTATITNVPAGTYHVRLETDGCFYTQEVKVIEDDGPTVQAIEIQGSTVTIIANGSTPPYLYALDNGNFQSSNIFTNVTLGKHTIQIRSNLGCSPISKEFSLIKLINFLSPNGDGKNDLLDYSQLKTKKNAKFIIYDRFGKLVFEGNEKNNYSWDGKSNGFELPSDSYWYSIEWTEDNSNQIQKYNGSLLLKRKL